MTLNGKPTNTYDDGYHQGYMDGLDKGKAEREKLIEALRVAGEALSRVGTLTMGPSFETQDDIMVDVLGAKRTVNAALGEVEK